MAGLNDVDVYLYSGCGAGRDERVRECLRMSGFDDTDVRFLRTSTGKPYIEPCVAHFSVSHSGGIWACAVSGAPVGFDVELVRYDRPLMAIAKRFFHPDEYDYLETAADQSEFFTIWTAKESYVKFTGRGLYDGFDHFNTRSDETGLQYRHIPLEGYRMCVCAESIGDIILRDQR